MFIEYIMGLTGGKRKVNKSLKAWVAFVKRVQKEEKLSYKEAIHRAKVRKDKGEKWMKGGADGDTVSTSTPVEEEIDVTMEDIPVGDDDNVAAINITEEAQLGGRRRRRRTMRRSRGRGRGRTMRRSRSRSSRRH